VKVEGFEFVADLPTAPGAETISNAVTDSVPIIEEMWRFKRPRRAKVVVWTDWMDGYRKGIPSWQRLFLPLMRKRIETYGERLWKAVGGITLRSQPPAVLIKPPHLLAEADVRLGEKLFVRLDDITDRVRSITCHELVHAYANSRALPPWLNEGIAMLTVDRFFGFDTVKPQTLELLGTVVPPLRSYLRLTKLTDTELVNLYARGYWITRYLHEEHPATLRRLLGRRLGIGINERRLARAVGVTRRRLWSEIDGIVFDHYHG
jgi:hypothetical protein